MYKPTVLTVHLAAILLAVCAWGLAGCNRSETMPEKPEQTGESAMEIKITSTAFSAGQGIPRQYTGEGKDISPPLSWGGIPAGAKELAMIVDDPDAPTAQPWVHWVIYKMPADTTGLSEGIAASAELSSPAGAAQGKNTAGRIGYHGPMPPPGHGVHHYHFKLYALDSKLQLAAGADKEALLKAMKGHILAQGELIGTYQR